MLIRIRTRVAFLSILLFLLVIHLLQRLLVPQPVINPGTAIVGLVQASKQNARELRDAEVEEIVLNAIKNAGGLAGIIKPGGTVLIKVNLVDTLAGSLEKEVNGITVDWRVTRAVVRQVLAAHAGNIFIIEGSLQPTAKVYQYFGYQQISELPSDHLIALEEDIKTGGRIDQKKLQQFKIKEGLIERLYYVDKRLLKADTLISIAVLKTHRRIAVSGTVKNVGVGCYPASLNPNPLLQQYYPNDRGWGIDHRPEQISRWIADYYSLIPAKFGIIDGLQGAQNGPLPDLLTDRNMNMRLVIAGADPLAVDTVEALVMGIEPENALYLKMLERKGIGITNPAQIRVVGNKVASVRKFFQTRYGKSIPPFRELKVKVINQKSVKAGVILRFKVISSAPLARLELVANGEVVKIYDPGCSEIFIEHPFVKTRFILRVYNIYLDEAQVEVSSAGAGGLK